MHAGHGTAETRVRGVSAQRIQAQAQRLEALARQLHAVSPLAVLGRGYAIVTTPEGAVVETADAVALDAALAVQLKTGRLQVRVTSKDNGQRPLPSEKGATDEHK